ncbi:MULTISPECIES: shikimate dehydrogenase [Nitrosomonas]|uniref:Shikimate dehydrogenase (NADP(+)) n=1 Tax=Nitrosomonas communis TaxID=44574 RepID=A0A0F7KD72_9PROT|nr:MULTISPECIES: shikimate dehydrogenase [Nitrosomonas]AKH37486.1 shikimate dehydrogenase [Nitrosomonas communis]TYP92319.1 shikimate dehydrogenase [Nitrosomonas communis]UVS62734.1 shikimate dehydrogenase [Nitrosomonas sp. PLL12]
MPDFYAVIGNPIHHSKSPLIHKLFAQETRQDMQYEAILAPLDGFESTVRAFQQRGGMGMNVTLPFKLEAYALSTRLTDRANAAQAVNTLKFIGNNDILGDNTDGAGLMQDIEINQRVSIAGKNILLMGAGGAARGTIMPLLTLKPRLLAIANRTKEKAQVLQRQFSAHGNVLSGHYHDFSGESFDIIINATSASLHDELPSLPEGIFSKESLAYDMMYSQELTPFLRFAQQQGVIKLVDGIGMLVEQAAESFFLWRGIRPETKKVIEMLKNKGH